ncbi:MAG TPA: flagellar biosynthetic protein FliQ [Vampirovibrionales bacterium]
MLGPLRDGLMTILIIAGPVILSAAGIGLLIGILQAATQIQDQTIPSAVKLTGIMLLLIFLGAWMFGYMTRFTERSIATAFSQVINNRNSIDYSEEIENDEEASDKIIKPPFSNFGRNFGGNSLGRLSSTNGEFKADLAPPIQAFSNVLNNRQNSSENFDDFEAGLNDYSSIPSFSNSRSQQTRQRSTNNGVRLSSPSTSNNERSTLTFNENAFQEPTIPMPSKSQTQKTSKPSITKVRPVLPGYNTSSGEQIIGDKLPSPYANQEALKEQVAWW